MAKMPSQPMRSYSRACVTASAIVVDATPATTGNTTICRCQYDFDDAAPLWPRKIREFSGRAERCQTVHASGDQIVAQSRQNLYLDFTRCIERGNQVREYAVKVHRRHHGSYDFGRLSMTRFALPSERSIAPACTMRTRALTPTDS